VITHLFQLRMHIAHHQHRQSLQTQQTTLRQLGGEMLEHQFYLLPNVSGGECVQQLDYFLTARLLDSASTIK
jgi:hypothetical protein